MPCAPRSAATAACSPACAPMTWARFRSAPCSGATRRSTRRPSRRCCCGCANQAGEDNRNVARMAAAAGGPAGVGGRGHPQPPVRLRARCARQRRAPDPLRRGAGGHRRWRRVDVARALRHAEGRRGLRPQRHALRHHSGMALREPAPGEAVRGGLDARDRRERRRAVQGEPRRPGPVRAAQPGAHRGRLCAQLLRQRTPAVEIPQRKGPAAAASSATSTRARPRWRSWQRCPRRFARTAR